VGILGDETQGEVNKKMDCQAGVHQSAICVLDEVANVAARLEVAAVEAEGERVEAVVRNFLRVNHSP
jgi:hypothetical protein